MRLSRFALVLCGIACPVFTQDLSPEVLLLSRVRTHLRGEFAHLPDYTCLETIERFHKEATRDAKFRFVDTVRLEIGYNNRQEWYAWPGDSQFTVDNPASLAGNQGLIASGAFAITLHNLFNADRAMFTPRGEDTIDSRKAAKFDFRFQARSQIAKVSILGGSDWVNEEGSFWVDPQSLELLRLDAWATEIPPNLPLRGMEYSVTFVRTHIGESDALLAEEASVRMTHNDGFEDFSRIAFTHCRMFKASSTLRFDVDPAAPDAPTPALPASANASSAPSRAAQRAAPERNVPARLQVTIQVTSPISSEDEAGTLIEGRVVGDVRRKGTVVLEDGAPVHGRIRRLERYEGGDRFVVGLEFDEVESHTGPLRFYADVVRLQSWNGVQPALRREVLLPNRVGSAVEVTLRELPGVASFFVEGNKFVLPPGLRIVWRTRELLRGEG